MNYSPAAFVWNSSARAEMNQDFINIITYSGYKRGMADPAAPEHILSLDVSDEKLGSAVLEALKHSRHLSLEEAKQLRRNNEKNYKAWIKKMIIQYEYKTKGELFKAMKACDIESTEGSITLFSTHHDRLESWSWDGIREEDYVEIPMDSPPAAIGAGLRLAFSRCTA